MMQDSPRKVAYKAKWVKKGFHSLGFKDVENNQERIGGKNSLCIFSLN